jgi:uncharacterized Zn finger protein (UPF0148 family)
MEKFCTNCGEPLKSHYKVCPNCGQAVNNAYQSNKTPRTSTQASKAQEDEGSYQLQYQKKYSTQASKAQEGEGDTFGWGILGFFFPLVGFILFLVWQTEKPLTAKSAGTGALIGLIAQSVFGTFFITSI